MWLMNSKVADMARVHAGPDLRGVSEMKALEYIGRAH
jgi:hypothetical protein